MRKFTIGQLEIRRLDRLDILLLLLYAALVALTYIFKEQAQSYFLLELITCFFCTGVLILSPIGIRLRSIYFSIIWLLLSLLFIFNTHSIAWIPLFDFLLYHIVRLVFWTKHDREFIPFTVGRGALYRYISKIEHMGGSSIDKGYMKLLIGLGLIVNLICLMGMIGIKVR
ncbi:hypothetical protein G7092_15460 [Mucilaginibacter sp. HC2]|uniref:hypothetical protein n=1 Tax=Mucilaginibacter inviolabilis TaxID=2714892 RepID=UPI00140B03CF|nr:hypothetical protein [Mucilaginibacter inviolabilis]NHA05206.1 hypothetical protein [Mucilaginibacter inviolabilis]